MYTRTGFFFVPADADAVGLVSAPPEAGLAEGLLTAEGLESPPADADAVGVAAVARPPFNAANSFSA